MLRDLRDDYWDYYNPNHSWDEDNNLAAAIVSLGLSPDAFLSAGFSQSEAESLLASGYITIGNTVIDRYYGGLLTSTDSRTRFSIRDFAKELSNASCAVQVYKAKSIDDVRTCVERWQSRTTKRLLFRGQTQSYAVNRRYPNPFFQVDGYGEVSLLPSLWRKMTGKQPSARQNFRNIHLLEWLRVLRSTFDAAEINRRVQSANAAGSWIHSSQDMEDSDDPVLKKLGRLELDLSMGMEFNLATHLQTLLQHYGLLSPVLDLTSDLDVALFFATNRFVPGSDGKFCSYVDVGTNGRRSVICVIRESRTEMEIPGRDRLLEDLDPLRPRRQSCVVCRSGPDAMNLAADFLYGIIALDFDDFRPPGYDSAELFPGLGQDRFLAALKANLRQPEHLTVFSN